MKDLFQDEGPFLPENIFVGDVCQRTFLSEIIENRKSVGVAIYLKDLRSNDFWILEVET